MKALLILFALSANSVLAAPSCPDLSGTWNSFYNKPVRFEQEGCERLVRHSGYSNVGGREGFAVRREFRLDGTPFCAQAGKCESARVEDGKIKFSFDFDARRDFADHGTCTDRGTTLDLLPNGNLQSVTRVESCADGYNGDFVVEFTKWKKGATIDVQALLDGGPAAEFTSLKAKRRAPRYCRYCRMAYGFTSSCYYYRC